MRHPHAAKAITPFIKSWLTKANEEAKLFEGQAGDGLFGEAYDFLICKPELFNSRYASKLADFDPSFWYSTSCAGHIEHLNGLLWISGCWLPL